MSESARPASPDDVTRIVALAGQLRAELATIKGGAVWLEREAWPQPLLDAYTRLVEESGRADGSSTRVVVGTIDDVVIGYGVVVVEPLRAGERMASMMAPTVAFASADGALGLALGAAGGTRLRTALVGVLGAVQHEGVEPQEAIDRPRFHPAGEVVNAEPGVDEAWLSELERRGRTVRRWPGRHHYFGGVSAVGRSGAGADPRRSGAVRVP